MTSSRTFEGSKATDEVPQPAADLDISFSVKLFGTDIEMPASICPNGRLSTPLYLTFLTLASLDKQKKSVSILQELLFV